MKSKLILGAVMGAILISATGCDEGRTLTCTNEADEEGAKLSQQVIVSFDKQDVISHIKITSVVEAEDDYEDELDDYEEMVKESIEDNEDEYIKISYKRNGNTLSQVTDYYIDQMSDEEKEDEGIDDPDENSYDALKENFEDQGYTCK